MAAFNVVRFRVKPGMDEKFIEAHKTLGKEFTGFNAGHLIKTGDRSYCFVGEWNDAESIAANRPKMIANLDNFRDLLEDLENGLGVTDPVSGESIVDFYPGGKKISQEASQQARH